PLSTPRPPPSPLFPYTTLFRSTSAQAYETWAKASSPSSTKWTLHTRYASLPASQQQLKSSLVPSPNASPEIDSLTGPAALGCRRSEEHTSELQSRFDLVCRLLL